jgi:pinin/SDK/memA/ protein conserved region
MLLPCCRALLSKFIRTSARPQLQWLPSAHTAATERLLDQEQEALTAWKVGRRLRKS